MLFDKKQMPDLLKLRDAVEAASAQPAQQHPAPASSRSPAERMAHLKEMLDQGLINPDEFEAKCQTVIDGV